MIRLAGRPREQLSLRTIPNHRSYIEYDSLDEIDIYSLPVIGVQPADSKSPSANPPDHLSTSRPLSEASTRPRGLIHLPISHTTMTILETDAARNAPKSGLDDISDGPTEIVRDLRPIRTNPTAADVPETSAPSFPDRTAVDVRRTSEITVLETDRSSLADQNARPSARPFNSLSLLTASTAENASDEPVSPIPLGLPTENLRPPPKLTFKKNVRSTERPGEPTSRAVTRLEPLREPPRQ